MYIQIAIAAAIAIGSGFAGWTIAHNACEAGKAAEMRESEAARRVDESFTQGVSTAYEAVASQLRRMSAVNRIEVIRETQKVEYRCPLLPDGERLRIDGIRAANAAASQPDGEVPADPGKPGEGSGRTPDGLFGTDGDVR